MAAVHHLLIRAEPHSSNSYQYQKGWSQGSTYDSVEAVLRRDRRIHTVMG